LNECTGTIIADASNDKKQKGKKAIRVRLGDNGCEVLWGRHFTSERWRLFRGNGVARTVEEQKAGLLMDGLTRLGEDLQDLSAAHKPIKD